MCNNITGLEGFDWKLMGHWDYASSSVKIRLIISVTAEAILLSRVTFGSGLVHKAIDIVLSLGGECRTSTKLANAT